MICDLKSLRTSLDISQVTLAQESGVSLPTIQNIEADKANPTIEIMEKLVAALGLKIWLKPHEFEAERAIMFGVPLSSVTAKKLNNVIVNPRNLYIEIRKWLQIFEVNGFNEREEEAVIAFLKGLKDHYPEFSQKISIKNLESKIQKLEKSGKIIKLRRIALSNMSKYL